MHLRAVECRSPKQENKTRTPSGTGNTTTFPNKRFCIVLQNVKGKQPQPASAGWI